MTCKKLMLISVCLRLICILIVISMWYMHEQYNRLHNAYFWSCVHTFMAHAMYWYLTSSSSFILLLMSPDKVKKREIEMKPNQAYETVILPSSSRSATQVHTEPCPAYEVVVHTHHWGLDVLNLVVETLQMCASLCNLWMIIDWPIDRQ